MSGSVAAFVRGVFGGFAQGQGGVTAPIPCPFRNQRQPFSRLRFSFTVPEFPSYRTRAYTLPHPELSFTGYETIFRCGKVIIRGGKVVFSG